MILITRPLEDAKIMAAMLENKGLKCLIAPMLEIVYNKFSPKNYTVYVATSKHGKKYAPKNSKLISIPEYGKDAKAVFNWMVKNLKKDERILYLRGREITLDLTIMLHEKGFDCDEAVVYEAKPVAEFDVDLSTVTLATFMSAASLKSFVRLSDERGFPVVVLSKKIAEIAKAEGFTNITVAPQPTLESMVSVIAAYEPQSAPCP